MTSLSFELNFTPFLFLSDNNGGSDYRASQFKCSFVSRVELNTGWGVGSLRIEEEFGARRKSGDIDSQMSVSCEERSVELFALLKFEGCNDWAI
jgi:hypothetical protein